MLSYFGQKTETTPTPSFRRCLADGASIAVHRMNGRALHFATVADACLVGRTFYLPPDPVHATITPVGPGCENASGWRAGETLPAQLGPQEG